MLRIPRFCSLFRLCPLLLFLLIALSGCAVKKQTEDVGKYYGDEDEVMTLYTPRDDGVPLSPDELYAFKTVSDLDRNLSEEDARIVELHFKFFVHERRGTFERFMVRSSRFLPHIKKVFTDRGIPEDIAYLCMVESGGNPNARSHAGAVGLWQFIPGTGRRYGLIQNAWIDERRDPYKATYAASDYLLKLYGDFGDWHLAVAAYNAGEGKIGRAVRGTGAKDFFELCRLDGCLEERARLKDETRDYVPRLIAFAKIMRNLDRLGFNKPDPDLAWNLSPLPVPPGTNLTALAGRLDLSWEEFSGMNPAFRRASSPPNMQSTAYVPPGRLTDAVNFTASREARAAPEGRDYTINKGDTLASIAKRHKVSATALREANGFDRLPSIGTVIIVPGKGPSPAREGEEASGVTHYTVRQGDTPFAIALKFGITLDALCEANNLNRAKPVLKVGQKLSVQGARASGGASPSGPGVRPSPASASSGAAALTTTRNVTVQAGDTLFSIAAKNGTSVSVLQKANKLGSSTTLKVGQKLIIPVQ
ncbi:MAG: LysM peptidoglycan-binding domain-containing protein [Desulfovibrionaceae bacterium]|nr:LysM peptidoglycan-binding domain-containing protein [Desulfovibrionaceae bacterium]